MLFNMKPYTVIQRKDRMMTAELDNHQIMWNSLYFKHVKQAVTLPEIIVESSDDSETLVKDSYRIYSAQWTTYIRRDLPEQQSKPQLPHYESGAIHSDMQNLWKNLAIMF